MKISNKCGIVGYGAYIPPGRITIQEIANVWKKDGVEIGKSLGIIEKAVPGIDEDAATMAIEAGNEALKRAGKTAKQIEAFYVGSESHPYAVNPTSTIVAEILGADNFYTAADMEFACKAGTAGIISLIGLVESGKIKYGMAIGTDCSQAKTHDALEYSAGAGAGAYIIGDNPAEIIVEIKDFTSFSSDTPDFWRRDGVSFPSHGGRFTGEPAYFAHVMGASIRLLEKTKLTPKDFDYCVFHMPNGKFPKEVATRLGFTDEQLKYSLVVEKIGNPYSASALLGLASILDIAPKDSLIFMASYGSGAGSDAFVLKTTKYLREKRKSGKKVSEYIDEKENITYAEYLKRTHKI